MIEIRIICLVIGYALGLFQTGVIYGKLHHFDLRKHGSGNSGMTNSLRTMGWKAGIIVFLGDSLKAVLAVVIVWIAFKDRYRRHCIFHICFHGPHIGGAVFRRGDPYGIYFCRLSADLQFLFRADHRIRTAGDPGNRKRVFSGNLYHCGDHDRHSVYPA